MSCRRRQIRAATRVISELQVGYIDEEHNAVRARERRKKFKKKPRVPGIKSKQNQYVDL